MTHTSNYEGINLNKGIYAKITKNISLF